MSIFLSDFLLVRNTSDEVLVETKNLPESEVNDFLNQAIESQGLDFDKTNQFDCCFGNFKDEKIKPEVS